MASQGLRERKKAALRALIVKVASRRFLKYGFEQVTLEDIASECDVSVRTVLRYFETKEALALAPYYDALEAFRRRLAQGHGGVLACWREHVFRMAEEIGHNVQWYRKHSEMVARSGRLAAQRFALNREYESLVATALIEETGADGRLWPRALAALLVSGTAAVASYWLREDTELNPSRVMEVMDAVEKLAPALQALDRLDASGSRRPRRRL